MKLLFSILLFLTVSALAQDGVTVRTRNGFSTNLTAKGTTTAQKIIATNVFAGYASVTNILGVGTTAPDKRLTVSLSGSESLSPYDGVHITGAHAGTGNKFIFDLDTVSNADGDLYGLFSQPRHSSGNDGSIIAVEGWLSASPHESSDGGYYAAIIGHNQALANGFANTVNYGSMFIARRAALNASVYAPIGDVVINDWVGVGLYDRESDAGLVTDLRGTAILPNYPFHFKDRSSLTNTENPGLASFFIEKVRLGNATNVESAAALYIRRSITNVASETGNFITANTKNHDVFSIGPNGNVYASVLSTNNTGPTEVARFEARDISNDQVRGIVVYGTTLAGLPVVGLGKSTTAPFGLFAFDGVTQLFNLADDGLASFTPSISSDAAFGVFSAGSSTPAFNVDTANRRVGVGLAFAPEQTLSVVFADNTVYSADSIAPKGVIVQNQSTTANSTAPLYFANGNSGVAYSSIAGVREGSVASALTFRTSNAGEGLVERMRITSSGNVGIGTAAPTNKLQVIGSAHITDTVYANSGSFTGAVTAASMAVNTLNVGTLNLTNPLPPEALSKTNGVTDGQVLSFDNGTNKWVSVAGIDVSADHVWSGSNRFNGSTTFGVDIFFDASAIIKDYGGVGSVTPSARTLLDTSGNVVASWGSGFVATSVLLAQTPDIITNNWAINTAFGLGTNAFYTSGAATIGITGVANTPTTGISRYGELCLVATGDIVFTNPASVRASDFLTTRTITNGNSAVIALDVVAGRTTNMAIVQFK